MIEKTSSDINPAIEVSYVNGRTVLNTKNSNYSYGSLHRVFKEVFKMISIKEHEIKDVLILGFGAGSVASILLKDYKINCKLTGIEKDDKIIDMAEKHFKVSELGEMNIIHADAVDFIIRNDKKYDLVVVDVYLDNDVPAECETNIFVENLGKALNDGGLLIFNKLVYNKDIELSAKDLYSKFQNILGETKLYKIRDNWENWMLIYYKGIVR